MRAGSTAHKCAAPNVSMDLWPFAAHSNEQVQVQDKLSQGKAMPRESLSKRQGCMCVVWKGKLTCNQCMWRSIGQVGLVLHIHVILDQGFYLINRDTQKLQLPLHLNPT